MEKSKGSLVGFIGLGIVLLSLLAIFVPLSAEIEIGEISIDCFTDTRQVQFRISQVRFFTKNVFGFPIGEIELTRDNIQTPIFKIYSVENRKVVMSGNLVWNNGQWGKNNIDVKFLSDGLYYIKVLFQFHQEQNPFLPKNYQDEKNSIQQFDPIPPRINLVSFLNDSVINKPSLLEFHVWDRSLESVFWKSNVSQLTWTNHFIEKYKINLEPFESNQAVSFWIKAVDGGKNVEVRHYSLIFDDIPPIIKLKDFSNHSIIQKPNFLSLNIIEPNLELKQWKANITQTTWSNSFLNEHDIDLLSFETNQAVQFTVYAEDKVSQITEEVFIITFDDIKPLAPSNFTNSIRMSQIFFYFDLSPSSDVQYYRLYQSTNPNDILSSKNIIASIETGSIIPYIHNLETGTYYFIITAVDRAGNESPTSNMIQIVIERQEFATNPLIFGIVILLLVLIMIVVFGGIFIFYGKMVHRTPIITQQIGNAVNYAETSNALESNDSPMEIMESTGLDNPPISTLRIVELINQIMEHLTPQNQVIPSETLQESVQIRTCGICHQRDLSNEMVSCSFCGMYFHHQELNNWIENHNKCPFCFNDYQFVDSG